MVKHHEKDVQSPTKTAWEIVEIARSKDRASSKDFINVMFTDIIELHGDRYYGDDASIFGCIAKLAGNPVTVIGVVKGKNTEENIKTNFGMVHPEGYRKALRLMKQAEKFKRPIITIIDTPGAFPGLGAEERGQGSAIAHNLLAMMELNVPTISIVIGEAGSGGALALAVSNQVWMLENAIYSILSPEGFASILYKDASRASDVAEGMKITSTSLYELGVIDAIIAETDGFDATAKRLKEQLLTHLKALMKQKPAKLRKQRYMKFRNIGEVDYEK